MQEATNLYSCLGDNSIAERIASAKVLVVGAGGIGCEILKNLVLSGFKKIKVIDLDTIEMSNLNRQFLFRKEHIGKSKALVAASVAKEFGEDVEIDAEHANIMNPKFDLFFFKSFNLVFNALDNVKARQYVNSMCVIANIPLIEGGSTGLLGQSYPIIPHHTECYNCRPRGGEEGEKYAICTIRSTPEKIEHNIVWAKELYVLLFGETSESLLFEEVDSVYMDKLKPQSPATLEGENRQQACLDFCIDLVEALFDTEIQKRVRIGTYTTASQQPLPIGVRDLVDIEGIQQLHYQKCSSQWNDIWDLKTSVNILIFWIWQYYLEGRHNAIHTFDKDCHGDIGTVLAIKKIAGNIIPALASTNAIVAGIQVLNAVKLLSLEEKDGVEKAKAMRYSYLLRVKNNMNRLLQSVTMMPPFSTCFTCCSHSHLMIVMDVKRASFRGFLEAIIRDLLQFKAPMISVGSNLLYEEPDPEEEQDETAALNMKNLFRTTLANLRTTDGGIQHGSLVEVSDCESSQHATITVYHQALDDITEKNEEGYIVLNPDVIEGILKTREEEEDGLMGKASGENHDDDDSDDDDLECVEEKENNNNNNNDNDDDDSDCCIVVEGPVKRSHEEGGEEEYQEKRSA